VSEADDVLLGQAELEWAFFTARASAPPAEVWSRTYDATRVVRAVSTSVPLRPKSIADVEKNAPVPEQPPGSDSVRAGCGTSVLYRLPQPAGDTGTACAPAFQAGAARHHMLGPGTTSDGGPAVTGYRPMTMAELAGRLARTADDKMRWKLVWEFLQEYRW